MPASSPLVLPGGRADFASLHEGRRTKKEVKCTADAALLESATGWLTKGKVTLCKQLFKLALPFVID